MLSLRHCLVILNHILYFLYILSQIDLNSVLFYAMQFDIIPYFVYMYLCRDLFSYKLYNDCGDHFKLTFNKRKYNISTKLNKLRTIISLIYGKISNISHDPIFNYIMLRQPSRISDSHRQIYCKEPPSAILSCIGVKPVIQPIRAKNIYKSSPFLKKSSFHFVVL